MICKFRSWGTPYCTVGTCSYQLPPRHAFFLSRTRRYQSCKRKKKKEKEKGGLQALFLPLSSSRAPPVMCSCSCSCNFYWMYLRWVPYLTLPTGLLALYLTLLDLIQPSLVVDVHVPTLCLQKREGERDFFWIQEFSHTRWQHTILREVEELHVPYLGRGSVMHWKCKCKVPGNAMYCDATSLSSGTRL